jgi:hypothetical protein
LLDLNGRLFNIPASRRSYFPGHAYWYCLDSARGDAGDILAGRIILAASDIHVGPSPARAGAARADDGDVVCRTLYTTGAGNFLDYEVGDGNAARRVSV